MVFEMRTYLTPQDIQSYGEDAAGFAKRAAADALSPAIRHLSEQNKQLQDQVQRLKSNEIYEALDRALPDWRTTNQSPEWHSWLRVPDPYSGYPKQSLLNDAFARGDVGRVLALFAGFMQEHGKGAQADKMRVRSDKRSYNNSQQPTFSRAAVKDFYDKVAKGYFKDEKQKDQLEAQIIAAGRDGRIV
jgi:hypothetical protein